MNVAVTILLLCYFLLPATKVIGAVLPRYNPGTLPVELETFVQSSHEHGVVIVSFGSMFDNLGTERLELLAAAFGRLKQKVGGIFFSVLSLESICNLA